MTGNRAKTIRTRPRPKARSKPHRPQGMQGQQEPFARLLEIGKALKLTSVPEFREKVEKILLAEDVPAAEGLIMALNKPYQKQIVKPNHFISFDEDLEGEFLLGHTEDGKPLGLDRDDLVRHVGIFGQSGSGKSTLLKLLFLQAAEKGVHVVHFDRKGDLEHVIRLED